MDATRSVFNSSYHENLQFSHTPRSATESTQPGNAHLNSEGEVSVRLTSCLFWLGLGCFEIKKLPWCGRFLSSKDEEVSHTDTSPLRIKVSVPWPNLWLDRPTYLLKVDQQTGSTTLGVYIRPFVLYIGMPVLSRQPSMRWHFEHRRLEKCHFFNLQMDCHVDDGQTCDAICQFF